jgi:hypothetical protein
MVDRALVIGGTGPTGPSLVQGLLDQGFAVTILHTGRHEVDSIPDTVEHLHTNPFRIDELAATVGDRTWDIVYAMYGRLRDIAPWFAGKTPKFVAVGGVPSYRGFVLPELLWPPGLTVPARERGVGLPSSSEWHAVPLSDHLRAGSVDPPRMAGGEASIGRSPPHDRGRRWPHVTHRRVRPQCRSRLVPGREPAGDLGREALQRG